MRNYNNRRFDFGLASLLIIAIAAALLVDHYREEPIEQDCRWSVQPGNATDCDTE